MLRSKLNLSRTSPAPAMPLKFGQVLQTPFDLDGNTCIASRLLLLEGGFAPSLEVLLGCIEVSIEASLLLIRVPQDLVLHQVLRE